MSFNNYVIIVIFSLFLLSSKTRATASVLLFVYVVYYNVVFYFHGLQRYAVMGTIEVLAGLYLLHASKYTLFKHEDNSIAETYFISACIKVLGGVFYWLYISKEYYAKLALTLMIIQIIILTWRVFKDGRIINRCSLLHPLFGAFVSNINQRYSFLQARKNKS